MKEPGFRLRTCDSETDPKCADSLLKSSASTSVAYPAVKCQACNIVNVCSAASVLPPCSSQSLYFMGKCWQDFRTCYVPLHAPSPQYAAFSASPVFKPCLVCKWVVWKNWAPKTSYCLFPTHPFLCLLPQPITIHFPKGAGIRDETRSVVLPETPFLLAGSAVKPELWCLSAGVPQFKFQEIHFLKPSFASLREFSSPFNVIESCKCAGIPHFSQRTDFILLEV